MTEQRTPLPHPLCANLCSKKLYMLTDDRPPALEELASAGEDNYWCRHSMTDTGPDGGWVRYERCAPGRSCFEAAADQRPLGARVLGL